MNHASQETRSGPRRIFFTAAPGGVREVLWSEAARNRAAKLGYHVEFNPHERALCAEEWAEMLADVDALITTWKAPCLDEAALKYNRSLKIVGHAAGSVAEIVSPELLRRGVRIVSANAEMAASVAQWSVMMTLAALWRFPFYAQVGRALSLDWSRAFEGRGLHGAAIGIWGFGEVARQLTGLLRPLGPKRLLVCSDWLDAREAARLGVEKVTLEALFEEAEVVHLLEGLTPATRGRVGVRELAALRDGAVLVNAGRALLVDERALLDHLREERTRAILDVHYREPLPEDSVWRRLPNVILTPHCAGWGRYDRYVTLVLDEFDRFFRGQPLRHEITPGRAVSMTDDRLLGANRGFGVPTLS